MPIKFSEKYINIYNLKDWSLIYKINIDCNLHRACFYKDINNNELYIIIANYRNDINDLSLIQKYDLKGNKIKEIKESTEYISFLDCFYDKITNNNFILAAFPRYIKAYDFNNNSIYKVYEDKCKCEGDLFRNIIINDYDKDIIKLIESCEDGYIRIWDFHKGKLIKRILVNNYILNKGTFGLCLWNNNYLFVGTSDDIVLVNINNEKKNVISKLNDSHNFMVYFGKNYIKAIKKIKHPTFGECLLSKATMDKNILLWTSNTINNILFNIMFK
jgi:WD40 repeat protein